MEALRIKLTQAKANYRREETIENKMTYPLPPMSTVIGALHKACGYTESKEMDVSIQGDFRTLKRETYVDYAFLNSTMNDRGILVKMKNPHMLSGAYEVVAEALAQGADFEKEDKIKIQNPELLQEYQMLRVKKRELENEKKTKIDPLLKEKKSQIKELKILQKGLDKKSEEYQRLTENIRELSEQGTQMTTEFEKKKSEVDQVYERYASLTKSIKFYEVLYDVELVIHVSATKNILDDIMENIYNLQSIGRSEDFVDVTDVRFVELLDEIPDKEKNKQSMRGYVLYDVVKNKGMRVKKDSQGTRPGGTKYYLNKNYIPVENKRVFEKKWVVYGTYDSGKKGELGKNGLYYDGEYMVSLI